MTLERKLPPPLVALLTALLMYNLSNLGPSLPLFQYYKYPSILLLISLGIILDFHSVWLFFKTKTTINPMTPANTRKLVTSGLYKKSRNPMYLGLVMFLLAWGFYLQTLLPICLIPLFIWYITKYQILPEERQLTLLFKEQYEYYCNKTPRWL